MLVHDVTYTDCRCDLQKVGCDAPVQAADPFPLNDPAENADRGRVLFRPRLSLESGSHQRQRVARQLTAGTAGRAAG